MAFTGFFRKKLSARGKQFYDLGLIYQKKNDFAKAREYFNKALETDPNHPEVLEALNQLKHDYRNQFPSKEKESSHIIHTTATLSKEYLKWFEENRFNLKKAFYADDTWVMYFEKAGKSDKPQWIYFEPKVPHKQIKEKWDEDYLLTDAAWDGENWLVVMTHHPDPYEQYYYTSEDFPKDIIKEKLDAGYSIEHLAKGKLWFLIMSKQGIFSGVSFSFHKDFPDKKIDKIWNEGKYITQVIYTGEPKSWLLIYADSSMVENQGYQNGEKFPLLRSNEYLKDGYAISHIAYGQGFWSAVYTELSEEVAEAPKEEIYPEPGEESFEDVMNELNQLVGLEQVKSEILRLSDYIKLQKIKQERGLKKTTITLHTVFMGNPGTGKTTVARILGRLFKALGLVQKGHVVEVSRVDLVGEFIGKTAIKTKEVLDQAIGGVLFIDEAYALHKDSQDFGSEAIETILKRMDDDRDNLVVIVAGYTEKIKAFIESNPGLESRFKTYLNFTDYSAADLLEIMKRMVLGAQHQLTIEAEELLLKYFNFLIGSKNKNFGNARLVRNLFEELIKLQAHRLAKNEEEIDDVSLVTFTLEDVQFAIRDSFTEEEVLPLESIMHDVNQLIGLENIKKDIEDLASLIMVKKLRKSQGLPDDTPSLHSIFYGPPGTGKTTIARYMGKIFKSLGMLSKGHVVEVSRADLVADFVGQTAGKNNRVINSALHGILFIDEAYALHKGGNDFGGEALEILLKRMEDDRDRLVVILAGYPDEMNMLLNSNPGLRSRFNRYFYFNDFSRDELVKIFLSFARRTNNVLGTEACHAVELFMEKQFASKGRAFGNARLARNFYEKCVQCRASRVSKQEVIELEDLTAITRADVENAAKYF